MTALWLLWLFAFVWTLAIELPIYVVMLGRHVKRWQSIVVLAFAVNAFTHPLLWFVYPRFTPRWLYISIGELAVFAIEAAILYAIVRRRSAIAAAFVANAASYALGNILFAVVL